MVSECTALSRLLKQYEFTQQQPIQIHQFHSGTELLCNYIPNNFDVIFLDIFMNDENGIECALQLRQVDPDVNIIFLTSSSEFGVKSYDVRAMDYIIKPASLEKIARALHYCKAIRPQNETLITVTTNHQPLEIAIERILYADVQKRSACIHLEDCLVPVSCCTFTELSKRLIAYPQFMACFKGIVVNLNHVHEVCDDCLILKNTEHLPVSRRLQREVQQQRLRLSAGSLRGNDI